MWKDLGNINYTVLASILRKIDVQLLLNGETLFNRISSGFIVLFNAPLRVVKKSRKYQ